MAKKKPTLQFSKQNICFTEKERHYKVISFNQEKMVVDCTLSVENEPKRTIELPFAHLPKEIKKALRPL